MNKDKSVEFSLMGLAGLLGEKLWTKSQRQ
jgi:hypothetical protein